MAEFITAVLYMGTTIVVSALLLVFIRYADRYEREPWGILFLTVVWGAIPAIILSCIFEVAFQTPISYMAGPEAAAVVGAVVIAPVVEEIAKAVAILFVVLIYRAEFDDVLDGMVYGAAVGIGFSFVEDGMYFIGALAEGGWSGGAVVFALRNIAFILNHSLFAALTGIGFGLARVFHRNTAAKFLWPLAGLTCAIAFHGLHNLLAHLEIPGLVLALLVHWAGGIGLLCLLPPLWAMERRWITHRLGEEVRGGFIPGAALDALPFTRPRRTNMPARTRKYLRPILVELAFLKRSTAEGWTGASAEKEEQLRSKVREIFPAPPQGEDSPTIG